MSIKTIEFDIGKYEGTTVNETTIPTGHGTMTYHNGDIYEGDWHNGKRNGKGKYYSLDNKWIYEGDWRYDKKHGNGTLFNNGDVYTGGWRLDKRHGHGEYLTQGGECYYGEWHDDIKSGKFKVILTNTSNKSIIDCYMVNDAINGEAIIRKYDGSYEKVLFSDNKIIKRGL